MLGVIDDFSLAGAQWPDAEWRRFLRGFDVITLD